MKPIVKKSSKNAAFTIVELLTVMSIIIILFGLLVPALSMVRRHGKFVSQNAQFHSIDAALQLFYDEFEGYPPSEALGWGGQSYCGAMKLAEALVGQDLLGFHPASIFRMDGQDGSGNDLYPDTLDPGDPVDMENLRARKGPYLPVEGAHAYGVESIYTDDGSFDPCSIVLCDEYPRTRNLSTGKRIGMPILYYKADSSKTKHEYAAPGASIYDYQDNIELINLGLPWDLASGDDHPMASTSGGETPDGAPVNAELFYDKTRDKNISAMDRPYKADSYILISAGFDGLYGTDDDVLNFQD